MKPLKRLLALILVIGLVTPAYADTSARVSGTWQGIEEIGAKVSGTWQAIQNGYVRVSGEWKEFFTAFGGDVREYTTSDTNPGTDTIPNGSVSVTITVYGAGQRGQNAESADSDWLDGAGGNGGGKAVTTIAIDPADWGETFSYEVGSSSEATVSKVDGTITAGTVDIDVGTSGIGGNVSNESGEVGTGGGTISGPGGPGGDGVDGVANGGSGAPGTENAQGEPGGDGKIIFSYE